MKLINRILIINLTLFFWGCNSLVEEPVYSFKTTTNSYITESDALTGITNCYFQLNSYLMFSQQYWRLLEPASGGITRPKYVTGNDDIELISKRIQSTNNSISDVWKGHYIVINSCNDALEGFVGMNIKPEIKNSVIGEALFLRSMQYFNLVRMWGKIPLRLSSTKGLVNAYTVASSEEEIYSQILSDLKKAAELLPATQTLKGRATKGAANALIAKVYLTIGSMKKYGEKYRSITDTRYDFVTNPDAYYDSVRVYCQKVILSGIYALPNDFASQFAVPTENSSESIFEIQFVSGLKGSGCQINPYVCPYTYGSCFALGWGTHRLTKKQYNDFYNTHPGDYRLESSIFGGYRGHFSQYTPTGTVVSTGDPKKDSIFVWPNPKASSIEKWPYLYKFRDPAGTASNQHGSNFIYLRYADVLLMAAEAENEIGSTERACDYVDQLMMRARKANGISRTAPFDWAGTGLSRDQFRLNIWNERHFELMGECHLWYDLIRTGQYGTYLKDHNESYFLSNQMAEYEMPFFERNILFPIPNNELNQNNLLTQNFGF